MKTLIKKTLFAAATFAVLSTSALAAGFDVNVTSTDLALRGVDPTSYFTEGKPVAGAFDITAEHHGATYRFVSEESKKAFLENPEKYLPHMAATALLVWPRDRSSTAIPRSGRSLTTSFI